MIITILYATGLVLIVLGGFLNNTSMIVLGSTSLILYWVESRAGEIKEILRSNKEESEPNQ